MPSGLSGNIFQLLRVCSADLHVIPAKDANHAKKVASRQAAKTAKESTDYRLLTADYRSLATEGTETTERNWEPGTENSVKIINRKSQT